MYKKNVWPGFIYRIYDDDEELFSLKKFYLEITTNSRKILFRELVAMYGNTEVMQASNIVISILYYNSCDVPKG